MGEESCVSKVNGSPGYVTDRSKHALVDLENPVNLLLLLWKFLGIVQELHQRSGAIRASCLDTGFIPQVLQVLEQEFNTGQLGIAA